MDRICELPLVEIPAPEVVEALSRSEVEGEWFERGFRLNPHQAGGVLAFDLYDGLFAPMGVGSGKTLLTLMIAERAFRRGAQRTMLMVPSQVYPQLVNIDIPWARRRVGLTVPFLTMQGRAAPDRLAVVRSRKLGCYIWTYSLLSAKDAEALLSVLDPDLVILDEAHNVKNPKAARTGRLMRMLKRTQPRVAALSGTITNKSIKDYQHLAAYALRENCPLPLDSQLAGNWSFVLDANADPTDAQAGPITPLIDWAHDHFPEEKIPEGVPGFRAAYRLRLNSCPGVVATGDVDIGTSLTFANLPVKDPQMCMGFDQVTKLMKQVDELWLTPSGDEIEYGFHKWRYNYELTSGFYYLLRWPKAEELVERRNLTPDEASAYLELSQRHHVTLQEYHRQLRRWIQDRARPGMDTPFLIGTNMRNHGSRDVGDGLYATWREAKELEFEGMPERLSEPVRLCDYKIQHAVRWAADLPKGTGALLWYWHDEVGRWLTEELKLAGLDPLWCPAESVRPGSNVRVLDHANKNRLMVVAMGGHGTGKNLQHFQEQVLLEFPRKADLLEQVIGRTHRTGQEADELVPVTLNSIEFDHQNMFACLIDALYFQQTTGAKHRAIFASYDPLPRAYPPDFLRERGFQDVHMLDDAAKAALEERFGTLRAA